ncbi:MAG: hypothetical protein ABIK83_07290 [Candidatus Zixiibacteriota bacterium]
MHERATTRYSGLGWSLGELASSDVKEMADYGRLDASYFDLRRHVASGREIGSPLWRGKLRNDVG